MDKNAIKTFAVESRRKMIESVKYQASLLGITADEIREPIAKAEGMETYDYGAGQHSIFNEDIKKRESLVKEVKNKGFENVVEEVAYTWFNRIIAIRFMEVNDYLPTRTRVLSSDTEGKSEPDIITYAFDLDLDYSDEDREKIFKLKDESKLDELFQFLFVKQCNKLNEILPGLFEKTDDYMELLLDISFTNSDGVVYHLINDIPKNDFYEQVEIIGWIYQFYNTELKDDTYSKIKKNKVPKERIPAATQIFTPDWIVKYMVENSLGKLWLEGHSNNELMYKWRYLLDETNQEESVDLMLNEIKKDSMNLNVEDIKVIDPCMGSGHILVYVFDVLMQIYLSLGYSNKEAVLSILKNNLFGLDIDDRAYQLAYFAIMMKAREYYRSIFKNNVSPNLFSFTESNFLDENFINFLINKNPNLEEDIKYLVNLFNDSKIYGSFLSPKEVNIEEIQSLTDEIKKNKTDFDSLRYIDDVLKFEKIINIVQILSKKFDVVITNPPYMGSKNMDKSLNLFLKKNYPNSDKDLFSSFKSFNSMKL